MQWLGKLWGEGGLKRGAEKRSIKMPSQCQFTVFPLFSSTLYSEIFVCTKSAYLSPSSISEAFTETFTKDRSASHITLALENEIIWMLFMQFRKCPSGRNEFIQPTYLLWVSRCETTSITHLLVKLKTQFKLKVNDVVWYRCLFCHCVWIRNLVNVSLELHSNSHSSFRADRTPARLSNRLLI